MSCSAICDESAVVDILKLYFVHTCESKTSSRTKIVATALQISRRVGKVYCHRNPLKPEPYGHNKYNLLGSFSARLLSAAMYSAMQMQNSGKSTTLPKLHPK